MTSVSLMPIIGIVAITIITVVGCFWIMNNKNK
jgi:heme/copper-type cytochrome/quinol oxidase subunit 4